MRYLILCLPPYANLSHTWGLEEVTFAGFSVLPKIGAKSGFKKIQLTCKQTLQDGLGYAWVDTCCINKESSSELSETINCMYKWYRNAATCYAYIEDLPDIIKLPITDSSLVKKCRWFSRGWTLQELLAPQDIVFLGAQWVKIGRKAELNDILQQVSVSDRMNWAANRQTTREEDIAYCLMGIFDVNMPMMYGEGRKAFLRLQEEIVKQTRDDSLFAWRAGKQSASDAPYRGLFASSPGEFASETTTTPFHTSMAGATTMLGNGRVSLSCALCQDGVLGLKCFRGTNISSVVDIEVIMFEKFAEMEEPSSLDDVYRRDGIHLAELPPKINLMAIHPNGYQEWEKTRMVPLVYVVGKKMAFELAVGKASGIEVFRQIGWNNGDNELASEEDIRMLLIVRVEQLQGTNSYAF
ncbi:heterokaryon incompatibility domain-containing protein [Trichoderma ceciliae]